MRHPLGGVKALLAWWTVALLGASVAVLGQTGAGDASFIKKAAITVDRPIGSIVAQGPDDRAERRFEPVRLTENQVSVLRSILLKALRKNHRDEIEAARDGQATAGVPGCVTFEYLLTFRVGNVAEKAWLHLGPGWLSGGKLVGNIVLDQKQLQRLADLLGSVRPCG